MAIRDPGRTDPTIPTQGFQLGQSAPQHRRSRARGAKEVELIVRGATPFGFECHTLHRGLRRVRLECVADESCEHPQIAGGGRRTDLPGVARAVLSTEREHQIVASQMARLEASHQAGEQAPDDKGQGLELIDGKLEIDCLEKPCGVGNG